MRYRALFLSIALVLSLSVVPISHAKAPVAGAPCSKVKVTQIFQGKKFTCIKSGKKLVWNKGVTIKITPTPKPTSVTSTSPTPTPTVTQSASSSPTQTPTTTPSATPTPTPTPTPSPTPTASTVGYTMDQVKSNNTSAKCWSVIDGNVYDLTRWINSHPGGAGAIRSLCGVDGTQEFNRQHSGQREPIQRLSSYRLGPLSK